MSVRTLASAVAATVIAGIGLALPVQSVEAAEPAALHHVINLSAHVQVDTIDLWDGMGGGSWPEPE